MTFLFGDLGRGVLAKQVRKKGDRRRELEVPGVSVAHEDREKAIQRP